jgi:hypothetical protein
MSKRQKMKVKLSRNGKIKIETKNMCSWTITKIIEKLNKERERLYNQELAREYGGQS